MNRLRLFLSLAAVAASVFSSLAATPKLVVTIIVDQMRYDYLERSPQLFSKNGFRLLLEKGAFMTSAKYNYFPTVTGPGHASYLSGSGPAVHGIIGNDWYDRQLGKEIYCCADTNVTAVGTTNKSQMSPRNFIGSTVADQMRLQLGSKVIGISLKDRGAILPAGKQPTGAFWFDSKSGNFITSTYYMTHLPPWVEAFNQRGVPQSFVGKSWERMFETGEYLFADEEPGEGKLEGETTNLFPHAIQASTNDFDAVMQSPFGDELVTQFALAALAGEALGQEGRPDLLCLSFSSTDMVGHGFGPYSHEIQDLTFRLDRQFEKLFDAIDAAVGLKHTVIVLTADHAVAPIPEFAQEMGLDGHRWDSAKFVRGLQDQLEKEFGSGKYFLKNDLIYGGIYFNQTTLRQKGLEMARISNFLREAALASGLFEACFTREQLLNGNAPGWIGQTALNGYNPARSPDLVLVGKPYGLPGTSKTGTTHGTPYSYDTRVPVIFYGPPFKPGRYANEFYITDIAPTLCSALHITEPAGSFGKVAVEILRPEN